MEEVNPGQQVVVTQSTKSVGVAVILAFLFGSIGMFYATVRGAIIMIILQSLFVILTFGIGFLLMFLLNPVCMIWAGVAAKKSNEKLLASAA